MHFDVSDTIFHVRLGAINDIRQNFPDAVIGFSDHSLGIYAALGAISLGACILEKHFTSSKDWPGPDVPISIDAAELAELIKGSRAIYEAGGGTKKFFQRKNKQLILLMPASWQRMTSKRATSLPERILG